MTSIFLSYARNDDEAFVRRLYADLTKAGFDVWFDRVSMPSRQLPFPQEIRDAIAACDRLLLVVGPAVLTSEWATKEWRFGFFEAGKCVNPIVRLNGRKDDGAVLDGYKLIPEELTVLPVHAEDFRKDSGYKEALKNLIRQLSDAIPPVGKLVAVPELPACFLAQPDRIKALRDLLLVDLQKPVVVSGVAARVGLQGMGGIGKSVLASALAHRPEVRRAFPDGVFWITLGQKPQLAELQRWLARELGDEALFPDERSGKECLRNLLAGRKALLVLDDVWQREDAEAFNVIGAMGRILLTTRDAGLVTALASKETHYSVELPTEAEAEAIFAKAAQPKPDEPPIAIAAQEVREIVAQCGKLPLALALCGGMVQKRVPPQAVLEALRRHALKKIATSHPEAEQHRNIWVAMEVSLEVLPPEERKRFVELAVFGIDRGAPQTAVDTLWQHTGNLEPFESQILLAELAERSLVQLTPATQGDGRTGARMRLHDLLHNFATGMAEEQLGSTAVLHQTLLDAYSKKCRAGWPSGPDDGYYFQNLCEHLLSAGKLNEAIELLTSLPWIEAKCKAKLVFSLQDDYRNTIAAMPEAQEGLRQERERQARLARWTEEITAYSRQWSERRDRLARDESVGEPEPKLPEPPASCRMWTEEEIEAECGRITEHPKRLDRMRAFASFIDQDCYPLLEFGVRPGFVAQHAFNSAPRGPVHEAAVEVLPDAEAPLLTRRWFDQDEYNPKPALLRTLEGHTDHVKGVATTSDGRRAISCSRDNTLRVWDLETGACLQVLGSLPCGVNPVSITADGRRAVSGGANDTLRIWNLEAGKCVNVLEGHTREVEGVSVTPDGRRAVSGGWDRTLRVWDLEKGLCLCVLVGHTQAVNGVGLTPDGRRALSVGSNSMFEAQFDNTLRVWDVEEGSCLRVLLGHTDTVRSVSVTPDSRYAVSVSEDNTLRLWDLKTGDCLKALEQDTDGFRSVSVTPDGLRAVSTGDKALRVWDLKAGTCLRVIEGHTDWVESVSVTPDGRRAVSASDDKSLRVWNLESGSCPQAQDRHTWPVESMSVTPDGKRAVSGSWDHTLRVWNLETGGCLRALKGHTDWVQSVSVTPDSRRVVSASQDKTLRVWDLDTGICLWVLGGHTQSVEGVRVMPDGHCAISWGLDFRLRVWDLDKGACLRVIEDGWGPVIVTPDGRRAISESYAYSLRVWDLETGFCMHVLEGHGDEVRTVDMSVTPDSRHLISAGGEILLIWDLEEGTCLHTLVGHTQTVRCVVVTPDGQRAVSGSSDTTLRVWDLATGRCHRVLEGHTERIESVSVTSDSLLAVSTSPDKTLRVWELETGLCLARACLPAPATSVALSSKLGQVVAGLSTGQVLQFDLRG